MHRFSSCLLALFIAITNTYPTQAELEEGDGETFAAYVKEFGEVKAAQKTIVWCWAACIEMSLGSGGVEMSQEQIVEQVKGFPAAVTGSDKEIYDFLNQVSFDKNGKQWSASCKYFNTNPSAITLINDLIANRPVIMGYRTGPNSGHVVMAHKVEFRHTIQGPVITKLTIYDPFTNSDHEFPAHLVPQVIRACWHPRIQIDDEKPLSITVNEKPGTNVIGRIYLDDELSGIIVSRPIDIPNFGKMKINTITLDHIEPGEYSYRVEVEAFSYVDTPQGPLVQKKYQGEGSGVITYDPEDEFQFLMMKDPDSEPSLIPLDD
jgi:hypothetical protein